MFNLFSKKIKPQVFYVNYTIIKSGQEQHYLTSGYSLDQILERLEEDNGPIKMREYLNCDLEEMANEYSEEKQSLKSLKQ